jgi:peroxiredoxin
VLDKTVLRKVLVAAVVIAPPVQAQAKTGQAAPQFTLLSLSGDSVRLGALRGHPVILKFWASWCPTCRTEMPELVKMRAVHRDAGLAVLAINGEETAQKIHRYLAKLGIDSAITVLLDPKAHIGERYGVLTLPTTVFVDTGGVVRTMHSGAISPADFAEGMRIILPNPQ